MSLVVAIQVAGNDVVLAADRRGTFGDPQGLVAVDENMSKLFAYGTKAAVGIVGHAGAVLQPVWDAQSRLAADTASDPVVTLGTALRKHYQDNYGIRPLVTQAPLTDARPAAVVLYADRRPGGVGLIMMGSYDNFTPTPFGRPYAMLGVNNYAHYLFQRYWRDDFTTPEATRLAAFLICETGRLEPKVGTTPDVMVLTEGGLRVLPKNETAAIVSENERRVDQFAGSFRSRP